MGGLRSGLDPAEHRKLFDRYFSLFPLDSLPPDAEGFDLGCGSGRWAALVAPRVGHLHCIDPAPRALEVAKRRLRDYPDVTLHLTAVDELPLAEGSQGRPPPYPGHEGGEGELRQEAEAGRAVPRLPPLQLRHRPAWFRAIWKASEIGRAVISRMPFPLRKATTSTIAALV